MATAPCGAVTGHGMSCGGTDPAWWCAPCQEVHRLRSAMQPVTVTLDRMLTAAEREVTMRRQSYPHMVAKKRMTPADAADEINAMQAIVEVLRVMQKAGVE